MPRHSLKSLVFSSFIITALAGRGDVKHPKPYHEVPQLARHDSFEPFSAPTLDHLNPRQEKTADGLTAIDTFTYNSETWTAYEDLTRFDGPLVLVSASGTRREIKRYVEASSDEAVSLNRTVDAYFGLDPANDVNLKQNDVLAERLLKDGEPVETHVRDVIDLSFLPWDTYLGNIYRGLNDATDWVDITAFADVDSPDPEIVHVWFSMTYIKGGVVRAHKFALDYKQFLPLKAHPTANDFYPALIRFTDYWTSYVKDGLSLTLPDETWADMGKHAFAAELVNRGGGVSPRYGAFERDYGGSEYDGFQDILTSSLTANLAWGRFDQAKAVLENYMDWYVYDDGAIKMRGPAVPQFGLSMSLIARYVQYTGDAAFVDKYKAKILAWVGMLTTRQDENLKLPSTDPYYGLISGWSESDAALRSDAWRFEKPYWNNAAFAARGLRDLSKIEAFAEQAKDWNERADKLVNQTAVTLDRFVQRNFTPPYVPVLPNETTHVLEDLAEKGDASSQWWPHRVYSELLQASVLSSNQTDMVIDSMRAYGITSLGVVANVTPLKSDTRDILGFISYGYALSLLLQDRIDEFVLFLYTHRYHPSEFTIPILLRAALLLDHPDDDALLVGRGVPRKWLSEGKVAVQRAPTKWGLVDLDMQLDEKAGTVTTTLGFDKAPPTEVRVKMRVPEGRQLKNVTVGGAATEFKGEEVTLRLGSDARNVTVVGSFS
uniref:Secreted protein n=1 Tax=Colletotrichum fructicola (strain Nara gc5) TaxID=1213859 RepID=L2FKN6_COLFN